MRGWGIWNGWYGIPSFIIINGFMKTVFMFEGRGLGR